MVVIIFKLDNNGNNNTGEDVKVMFEFSDTSKTIKEMLVDFIKNNNSILKIASNDISKFENTLSTDLLVFMFKNKILNKDENSKRPVKYFFKTNNNAVHVIDCGNILGGKKL